VEWRAYLTSSLTVATKLLFFVHHTTLSFQCQHQLTLSFYWGSRMVAWSRWVAHFAAQSSREE
jgi:hypothetical protein